MFKELTDSLNGVSHVAQPLLPKEGQFEVPLLKESVAVVGSGASLVTNTTAGISKDISLVNVIHFFTNLSWEYVLSLLTTELEWELEEFIGHHFGRYKEFLNDNLLLLIFATTAIGISLIPFLFFLTMVLTVFAMAFALFCIVSSQSLLDLVAHHMLMESPPSNISRLWVYVPCLGNGLALIYIVIEYLTQVSLLLGIMGLIVFGVGWKLKRFESSHNLLARVDDSQSEGQGSFKNRKD